MDKPALRFLEDFMWSLQTRSEAPLPLVYNAHQSVCGPMQGTNPDGMSGGRRALRAQRLWRAAPHENRQVLLEIEIALEVSGGCCRSFGRLQADYAILVEIAEVLIKGLHLV